MDGSLLWGSASWGAVRKKASEKLNRGEARTWREGPSYQAPLSIFVPNYGMGYSHALDLDVVRFRPLRSADFLFYTFQVKAKH